MTGGPKYVPEALQQAIAWHTRMTSGDETERDWHELTVWLEANPENRHAYEAVEEFSSSLSGDAPAVAREIASSRQDVRKTVPLQPRTGWVAAIVVLAAVMILFIALPVRKPVVRSIVYSAPVDRTLSVWLEDGSLADLNTGTTIRVQIETSRRRVDLVQGEALFHVAKDPRRPFVVGMGSRMARVTGTVFDVIREPGWLRITVAEGHVRFSDAETGKATSLSAGDQLVYSAGSDMRLQRVDPSVASDWQRGYLVYKKATLADIVDDLNRYFPRRVVIADRRAGLQTFSGVLRIDREEVMLSRLSRLLPVRPDYRERVVLLRSVTTRE